MLQLANHPQDHYWGGDILSLHLSFDSLRDYQWKRLLEGIWAYPNIMGPIEKRYIPHQATPPPNSIRLPEPTSTVAQYGLWEVIPSLTIGIEVLATRSLFECISILIPLQMFKTTPPEAADLQLLEGLLHSLALHCYKISHFELASLGVNRDCPVVVELMGNAALRTNFLAEGSFFAQINALSALHSDPNQYQKVLPSLYWMPRP